MASGGKIDHQKTALPAVHNRPNSCLPACSPSPPLWFPYGLPLLTLIINLAQGSGGLGGLHYEAALGQVHSRILSRSEQSPWLIY